MSPRLADTGKPPFARTERLIPWPSATLRERNAVNWADSTARCNTSSVVVKARACWVDESDPVA